MIQKQVLDEADAILSAVVEGMQEKKGRAIVSLEFSEMPKALCDYFVICHGVSRVQAEAIAEGVEDRVRSVTGAKPWNREGFENAEWILLDYVNVVVHIFQQNVRDFYQLEKLWADAPSREYASDN
jgi:ribosome-associated protein